MCVQRTKVCLLTYVIRTPFKAGCARACDHLKLLTPWQHTRLPSLSYDGAQNRSAMRLTLINQTGSTILYHPIPTTIDTTWQLQIALLPSSSITTDLPKRCSKLTLIPREQVKHDSSSELGETRLKEMRLKTGFDVCIKSFVKSRTWEMVDGTEECPCPWRIYRMKVCFRRLIDIFLMIFCGRYQGHTIT
jgi:hypothetical protein